MNLDEELESIEETGQTEAEQIDEETEIQDVEDDIDEMMMDSVDDAQESDLEHAFSSFETRNEADYDGYNPTDIQATEVDDEENIDVLHDEGYHVEDSHDLEEELIEMEIEDGDIYAYLVDEDDNEIGFVLLDENGDEQEYYYVDMDEYEIVDADGDEGSKVIRTEDGEEFDLGITREGVADATADLNAIYKDGAEVAAELKETMEEIGESMSFLRKRR